MAGFVLYFAGRTAESARKLEQLVQAAPTAVMPRQFLARALLRHDDAPRVIELLEGHNDPAPGAFSSLARAYAMTGRGEQAAAEIARVEALGERGFGVGFDLALVQLALGDRDRALASIARAVDDHSQMVGY
jgi:predicted Zn-dependent protease